MENNSKSIGIVNTIEAVRGSKRVEVMSLFTNNKQSLDMAATISKLVKDTGQTQHTQSGTREIRMPDAGTLQRISEQTSRNINENETIYSLIPDYEACIALLVSSVLSPKDLMSTEIIFNPPADVLPPDVSSNVINALRNHFEQSYKIKSKLPKMLREVLFTKGSHILAVLPENAVDDLINRDAGISLESIRNAMDKTGFNSGRGYLGDPTGTPGFLEGRTGLESMVNRVRNATSETSNSKISIKIGGDSVALENITVTDNPNILRIQSILNKVRRDNIRSDINYGLESVGQDNTNYVNGNTANDYGGRIVDKKLTALIYKNAKGSVNLMTTSKSQNQLTRRAVTNPLIMQFPSESVIPVFVPGQYDRHIGYFVLLDMNGNPVCADERKDSYQELQNQFKSANSQQSQLISRMNTMLNGIGCPENLRANTMVNTYADLIEQDLLARLRNGKYNNDFALGRTEDVFRVMLARTLSQRRTQILFLPVEQVTYFATRYNKNGMGVSIMDETKFINTQRAIVSLANTMASVRNSIGRTIVDIKIDPTDPDPRRRFEELRSEYIRAQHLMLPFGVDAIGDMVTSLQMSGHEFKISGHEGIPDMAIDISQSQSSYTKVDTDHDEQLRRRGISATGLTAEGVDNNFNGVTATSVVSSNIMLSRKVMIIQDEFVPHLTDHLRKVALATPAIMQEIYEIIEGNYEKLDINEEEVSKLFEGDVNVKRIVIKQIIKDFMNGLEVTLPRPTTVSLENQLQTVNAFIDLLDRLLESWVNDDMLASELVGEISEKSRSIISSIRAHFIRQFCAENAILPELAKISTLNNSGEPELDIYETQKSHIETLIKSFGAFMKGLEPKKKASDALVQSLGDSDSDGGYDSSDSGSDFGGGDDAGDPFGDAGGDDPFGDMGGDTDGGDAEVTTNDPF